MPLPRVRLRTLMIAVAAVGLVLGAEAASRTFEPGQRCLALTMASLTSVVMISPPAGRPSRSRLGPGRSPRSRSAGAASRPWWRERLGLPRRFTEADVKAAFRRLAKRHHPDASGDRRAFAEVERAYREALAHLRRRDNLDPSRRRPS